MLTDIARAISTLILAILAFTFLGRAQEPPMLGVCEVLKDLEAYSRKTIAVHGQFIFGPGLFSVGSEERCLVVPETNGQRWPTNINLIGSTDSKSVLADPQSVKFIRELGQAVIAAYAPYSPGEEPVEITATFVGTLRTKELGFFHPEGFASGFGYKGLLPAQLDYFAVRDIVVRQITLPPKSETTKPE